MYKRVTLLTNPDRCNLACPLCFLNQKEAPFGLGEMDFSVVEKTLRSLNSAHLREVIPSTMGEPLLYPHFEKLLDLCGELSLKLNLTTNGTFPLGGVSYWAAPLLLNCTDIKISMMGISANVNEALMKGINQKEYLENIRFLIAKRKALLEQKETVSTISLQVTVCKKNWMELSAILEFAENSGINRIKWNKAIFLSTTPASVLKEYQLDEQGESAKEWQEVAHALLAKAKIPIEGTLFNLSLKNAVIEDKCPFLDEIWVLPDGSFEYCPSPERRFGNRSAAKASCEGCLMKRKGYKA